MAGIPVSTPSGEGGIVSGVSKLLKLPYRDNLRAKNHRQGVSFPYKGKKGLEGDTQMAANDSAVLNRLMKVDADEWEQAVRRANGDSNLAGKDEIYAEIASTVEIAEMLMEMWFKHQAQTDDTIRTVEAFCDYCENVLFSEEGEGCHVTSVHRYKGDQDAVSFLLRGVPATDRDGNPTIMDPFMRPFVVEQSPESAIEQCNVVYVASSRSKDMNIRVTVLDDDAEPVGPTIDRAFGIIRDSMVECGCCASYDECADRYWSHKHDSRCNHITKAAVDYDEILRKVYYCNCDNYIRDSVLSDKAQTTIDALKTTLDQWGFPRYIIKEETRRLSIPISCPDCKGRTTITTPIFMPIEERDATSRWDISDDWEKNEHGRLMSYRSEWWEVAPRIVNAARLYDEIASAATGLNPNDDEAKGLWIKGDSGFGPSHPHRDDHSARTPTPPAWVALGYEAVISTGRTYGHSTKTWWADDTDEVWSSGVACNSCRSTRPSRGWRGRGEYKAMGYHMEWRDVLCDVYYPAWPHGTEFSSRFHQYDCEICGKNGIKSGAFPVLAVREDGSTVGMFVGNDCVKKMGHTKFKNIKQLLIKNKSHGQGITILKHKPRFYERSYETHDESEHTIRDSTDISLNANAEYIVKQMKQFEWGEKNDITVIVKTEMGDGGFPCILLYRVRDKTHFWVDVQCDAEGNGAGWLNIEQMIPPCYVNQKMRQLNATQARIRDSAQYVSITLEEMDAFLVDSQGFTRVDPLTYEERHIGQFCRECVYEYPLGDEHAQNASIRVYSSISLHTSPGTLASVHKSRAKGKDAIRCLVVNADGWPIEKFTRTHRVKNWRLNLLRKYDPTISLTQEDSRGHPSFQDSWR
jgi:hypothetical protein